MQALPWLSCLFLVMATALGLWLWKHRRRPTPPAPPLLVHSINRDLCVGCGKCVARCPADVLDLDAQQKSFVARVGDCIQCQQCMVVCPTPNKALVMHLADQAPADIAVPALDEFYQSKQHPGLYLIGEAAGKPLIKNGVNLGRAVIEHMLRRGGLKPLPPQPDPPAQGPTHVDVLIVGSGPAGLSAAVTCAARGLAYAVLERKAGSNSTVMSYPAGKSIHANPRYVRCVGMLPVWDCKPAELQRQWLRILDAVGVKVYHEIDVRSVTLDPAGSFTIETSGTAFRAQRVVLALGASQPRLLGRDQLLPGEDLAGFVEKTPEKSDQCRDQHALVIGGGDSALETAFNLVDGNNRVMLSYHGPKDRLKANAKNLHRLGQLVAQQRLLPLFESSALSFQRGAVRLRRKNRRGAVVEEKIEVAQVFACIGGDPPQKWLEQRVSRIGVKEGGGIRYLPVPHAQFTLPETDALVESLVGKQEENGQPAPEEVDAFQRWLERRLGRRLEKEVIRGADERISRLMTVAELPRAVSASGDGATTVIAPWMQATVHLTPDQAALMRTIPPVPMPVQMQIPEARYRIRLPEKARREDLERTLGPLPSLRELLER